MVDWEKPLQTREGCPAKLLEARDSNNNVVAYRDGNKVWRFVNVHADGRLFSTKNSTCGQDIVNVPEKRTFWVSILRDKNNGSLVRLSYDTEAQAREFLNSDSHSLKAYACIALFPVEYEDGQGLAKGGLVEAVAEVRDGIEELRKGQASVADRKPFRVSESIQEARRTVSYEPTGRLGRVVQSEDSNGRLAVVYRDDPMTTCYVDHSMVLRA